MTLEDMNRAIAEVCGYERRKEVQHPYRTVWWKDGRHFCDVDLPNYTGSLDAMHEAEKVLSDAQCDEYGMLLTTIMSDNARSPHPRDYCDWHATAAQRSEAFLRALGKWKD